MTGTERDKVIRFLIGENVQNFEYLVVFGIEIGVDSEDFWQNCLNIFQQILNESIVNQLKVQANFEGTLKNAKQIQ